MSSPTKPDQPTLKATEVPKDWKSMDPTKRVAWLKTQPSPSNHTISLGDCYESSCKLINYLRVIFKILQRICNRVAEMSKESQVYKYCANFIDAFNAGIGTFANEVSKSCRQLFDDGKYSTSGTALPPVEIKKAGLTPKAPEKNLSFWDDLALLFKIICQHYPALNTVRPGMNTSFAALFNACIAAGRRFLKEYFKGNETKNKEDETKNKPVGDGGGTKNGSSEPAKASEPESAEEDNETSTLPELIEPEWFPITSDYVLPVTQHTNGNGTTNDDYDLAFKNDVSRAALLLDGL